MAMSARIPRPGVKRRCPVTAWIANRVTFPEYCNPNYESDDRKRSIAPCSHEFIGARQAQLLQRTVAQRSCIASRD